MPKRSQNGSKIDAKTHQKSVPKLVTKKIRQIIQNHDSLNGEIIEFHLKNNGFLGFRTMHVRTGKVSTNIKNETNIHPKIDEKSIQKSCSKKKYPKDEKSTKK